MGEQYEMQPGKAYLLVRAHVVNEADRKGFDHWYDTDHLPLAKSKLKAERAWRFWSQSEPSVHYALYQFSGTAHVEERMASDDLKVLLADYDRNWGHVPRTREIIQLAQALP